MKMPMILRLVAVAACLLVFGWIIHHTRWVEVEVDNDPRGLAATDEYYSLRQVLQGAGSTLETRTTLEPLPPAGATLMLDSGLWNIFPERDARLKAWVESGGHLVLLGRHKRGSGDLRWVPLSFVAAKPPAREAAASDADEGDDADTNDDEDGEADAPPKKQTDKQKQAQQKRRIADMLDPKKPWRNCANFDETPAATQPAYEPGRVYRGCGNVGALRPLDHVVPSWQLTGWGGTLAMRVPVGRGDVTGVSPALVTDNHGLLQGDNALIAAAVLQAAPARPVWIIGDEAREPLMGWLWHEARTPALLALAAIALALWRLMVRFGPREAVPPQARRSMGEQVRGTGQFIAGADPQALHAATRKAFDDVARTRVEGWVALDDAQRVAALAAAMAHSHTIAQATLLVSMNIGSGATPAQILAATTVLEQARRALLRAPPAPLAN